MISATSFGSTQCTLERTRGHPKRVLRGGRTFRGEVLRASGSKRRRQIGRNLGQASLCPRGRRKWACRHRRSSPTAAPRGEAAFRQSCSYLQIWSKAQFPTSQPQAQRRASRRVSSCRSRTPQQGSAVPNRRTLRHPPPQLSPLVDRKTQNLIRIKCLSFRASETQQLRETGVTEIFWEPSASGAHLSEWARPEGRAAAGDAMRGRSSTGQYIVHPGARGLPASQARHEP